MLIDTRDIIIVMGERVVEIIGQTNTNTICDKLYELLHARYVHCYVDEVCQFLQLHMEILYQEYAPARVWPVTCTFDDGFEEKGAAEQDWIKWIETSTEKQKIGEKRHK